MNPKNSFIAVFLIISAQVNFAQYAKINDQTGRRLRDKLYVVYTGKPHYDSALKKAVSKYWTVTPITGFISQRELAPLIKNDSNSFLCMYNWPIPIQRGIYYQDLFCVFNGRKGRRDPDFNSELLYYCGFNFSGHEYPSENTAYRLPMMVHELNRYFVTGVNEKPSIPHALDDKILIIQEKNVDQKKKRYRSVDVTALSFYKHKYEILPEEKIVELIDARDGRYALAVPVWDLLQKTLFIYDLKTLDIIAVYEEKKRSPLSALSWVGEKAFTYLNDCLPDKKL